VFTLVGDEYSVADYTGDSNKVIIPSRYKNISVTQIGDSAFANCVNIETIVIPDTITKIGNRAFYNCSKLKNINIIDSIYSIGDRAFYNCESIARIVIPDSVTNVGSHAFSGCTKLEEITIPFCGASATDNANTHFGYIFGASSYSDNANSVPKSLKTVIITDDTTIDDYAFYDCQTIQNVTICDSVTSIGNMAFYNCVSLKNITLPFVGASKFATSNTHLGYIFGASAYYENPNFIPESLTNITISCGNTIDNYAFYSCSYVQSIKVGSGVTSIGTKAFYSCSALECIELPSTISSISLGSFEDCSSLASISIDRNNVTYKSSNNCIYRISNKTLVVGCKNTIIPKDGSVTCIASFAFAGCTGLTSIYIPKSVIDIDQFAFDNCSNLSSAIFESTGTWISSEGPRERQTWYSTVGVLSNNTTQAANTLKNLGENYLFLK